MSRRARMAAASFVAAAASAAHADVIDTRGMAPHEQCAYCHQLDGNSLMPRFPRLAGQSAAYLAKQLADFRAGRRTNDDGAMSGIAESLSQEEVEQVVGHFAAQRPRAMGGDVQGDVAAGRRLYLEGGKGVAACAGCHGVRAAAPVLAGQHARYLEKQLRDFKRGARANDPEGMMKRVAGPLTDEEIQALAAFLSAQPVMTGAFR